MSASTILIIITGIITYMGFNDHRLFEKYKFSVSGIQAGEYYRLITSAFLHADWNHFIFNMITLYFFGGFLTDYFDTQIFLLIYFSGVLAGNLLTYYFHKNDLWYAAIGASAGVSAVLFSFISLEPFELILVFFIPVPALLYAIGYLWYTVKGTQNAMSRIGHEAHFGGAIVGVLLTILLDSYHTFGTHPFVITLLLGALGYGYYYMEKNNL